MRWVAELATIFDQPPLPSLCPDLLQYCATFLKLDGLIEFLFMTEFKNYSLKWK